MAGPRICRSFHHNLPLSRKDELKKNPSKAITKSTNTLLPSLAISQAQTPAPALALAPSSSKKLCQQLLKTYAATVKLLEQNHGSGPCKQSLKAQFSIRYYGNLYMDCYRFH